MGPIRTAAVAAACGSALYAVGPASFVALPSARQGADKVPDLAAHAGGYAAAGARTAAPGPLAAGVAASSVAALALSAAGRRAGKRCRVECAAAAAAAKAAAAKKKPAAKKGAADAKAENTFDPSGELGVQAPTGFWDPAGFCDDITEQDFKRLRSCEIKHGRLAMIATIGYIAPFYGKLPGYLSFSKKIKFEDIPLGVQGFAKIPSAGFIQIILLGALIEFGLGGGGPSARGIEEWKTGPAGDYGRGFLGLFGPVMDPERRKRSLNSEIANGRLAMMAMLGIVIQEGVAGGTGIKMWVPPSGPLFG